MASFITWNTSEWIQMLLNMATSGRIGWNMFTITWIYTSHLWYERGHEKFDRLKGFNIIERKNMLHWVWHAKLFFATHFWGRISSQNGSGNMTPRWSSVDRQASHTFKNMQVFSGHFFQSSSSSIFQDLRFKKITDVK